MEIQFYNQALNSELTFAVIAARKNGKWIFCRRQECSSWEMPNGCREAEEHIRDSAQRLLKEQTGAVEFQLEPVSAFGIDPEGESPSFGALYFAEVWDMEHVPGSSITSEISLQEHITVNLTHPVTHSALIKRAQLWLDEGNFYPQGSEIFDFFG